MRRDLFNVVYGIGFDPPAALNACFKGNLSYSLRARNKIRPLLIQWYFTEIQQETQQKKMSHPRFQEHR